MERTPQTPNDPFYMSAPVNPSRISMEVGGLSFFSVPTSPTRRTLRSAYEDSSSSVDEFEFDTSRRFDVDECQLEYKQKPESRPEEPKESLPDMAFADELFSDGKVMPLKPPPRLGYRKEGSNLSSPRSPTGVLRFPFQRKSLWNDDFDPFMVALENVKDEKGKYHRRARSMSPFRERETRHVTLLTRAGNYSGQIVLHCQRDYQPEMVKGATTVPSDSSKQRSNEMGLVLPKKQSDPSSNKAIESNETENKETGRQEHVKQRQLKLAEPRGVVFARRTMLVKVGNEKTRKPSVMDSTGAEAGVAYAKQSKGQKIKNFLFRSESMGKMSSENKPKCYANGTELKPKLKRKFSLKAMGITKYNEEKRASDQVTLTTLVQYRPKLLLCMGYGDKYVK